MATVETDRLQRVAGQEGSEQSGAGPQSEGRSNRNSILATSGAPEQEEVDRDCYQLLFRIDVSRRYMLRRRDFLERCGKFCTFLNVFGGSAAFAAIVLQKDGPFAAGAALSVAVVGLIDMVYRFEHGAQRHDAQYKRYTSLQRAIAQSPPKLRLECADFEAKYVEIEIDDPYPREVLMQMCHNDALTVRQHQGQRVKIFFLRRWLAQLLDLPPGEWKKRS